MSVQTAVGSWIRELRCTPQPRARLVCMPHAGGSASFFRTWRDALPPDMDLLAVQYPGREDRYGEPCASSMGVLAEHTAQALSAYASRPLVLFGHSLGASLAYEVALRLERAGAAPHHVFVSAHPPPHRQRVSDLHRQDEQQLLEDVRRLSGNGPTLLDEPELRALFMPMLRADYQVIETYRRTDPPPLRAPIDVLLPTDDTELTRAEAEAWQDLTQRPLAVLDFTGGHFYLKQQPVSVIERLLQRIDAR